MIKTVMVTIEKEIEVEIPDDLLTPEVLKLFSETMYPIEGADGLFEHFAIWVAQHGGGFVEGIGPVSEIYNFDRSPQGVARFWVTADTVEADVLEQ